MLIESNGHRDALALPGINNRLLQHALMANVNAIKHADSDTDRLVSGIQLGSLMNQIHPQRIITPRLRA
jgi:hypothetical protein